MNCFLLSDDLMFTSQISGGLGPNWTLQSGRAFDASEFSNLQLPDAMVVDLSMSGIDLQAIAEWAKEHSIPVCGVASHVHAGKLDAAKQAGFTYILTKGQIQGGLAEVLSESS